MDTENKPISVGEWLITLIILAIPIVNLVMLIVWAMSSTTPPSKQNYAKATLILAVIAIGFGVMIAIISLMAGGFSSH